MVRKASHVWCREGVHGGQNRSHPCCGKKIDEHDSGLLRVVGEVDGFDA